MLGSFIKVVITFQFRGYVENTDLHIKDAMDFCITTYYLFLLNLFQVLSQVSSSVSNMSTPHQPVFSSSVTPCGRLGGGDFSHHNIPP